MNIVLFGGFLGSGKTTALIHAAKFLAAGHRVAIIENEIGAMGIDDQVIAAQGLKVTGIFAGCVCCQMTGELVDTVMEIHRTIGPDWLVIEATGLADPGSIAATLQAYCRCLDSLRTIVLVDAERWEELYAVVEPLLVSQVRAADAILLNKVDLVDAGTTDALVREITKLNGKAAIHLTSAVVDIPDRLWQEALGR